MRVYRLRLFGCEIASFEVDGDQVDITAAMREAIEQLADDTENNTEEHTEETTPDDTADPKVGGASSHNFERDMNPRYPETENDCDSWITKPFGFAP